MVSVLIPTFRRPRFLLRALRSLQAQAYPDWEVLVVDDGEGEGVAAARALGDPRVRPFPNPGRGQVEARNAALSRARGEVVALLDDDDWWEDPYHLHRILRALSQGPTLAYRGGWLVREEGGLEVERLPFLLEATPESLRRDNTLLASGVAYPLRLHEELGPFDPGMGDYWDWDWYLRVVGAGYPLRRLPGPGVAVAVHGANASYGVRLAERRAYLERLRAKHGLGEVGLKDHLVLLREGVG
jgi:glycosyltransferase involved in cell wall biosynthesis